MSPASAGFKFFTTSATGISKGSFQEKHNIATSEAHGAVRSLFFCSNALSPCFSLKQTLGLWRPEGLCKGGKTDHSGATCAHTDTPVCVHTHSLSQPSHLQIFLSLKYLTLLTPRGCVVRCLLCLRKHSIQVWILGSFLFTRHMFRAARHEGSCPGLGLRLGFSSLSATNQLCDMRQLFNRSGPQFHIC